MKQKARIGMRITNKLCPDCFAELSQTKYGNLWCEHCRTLLKIEENKAENGFYNFSGSPLGMVKTNKDTPALSSIPKYKKRNI